MRSRKRLVLGLLLTLPGLAQAQTRLRPFFQASRALAMGDAYTAYDIGYEAVYYNPAGVAKRNQAQVKYIDFELLGSQAMYNFFRSSIASIGNLSKLVQNVAQNPGVVHSLGLGFFPQLLLKNFSIGLIARTYTEAYVDPTTADLDFFGYTDAALYTHLGASLFGGVVKVGAGFKALNRAELNRTYTPAEYASGVSFGSQWQEGIGYGIDLGVLVTAPISGLPTLGIAVQDFGSTKLLERRLLWTGSKGAPGTPPNLPQRINSGFAISVKHSAGVRSGFSVEMKDVQHANVGGMLEHFHAGWELNVQNAIYIRAGVNQGRYWTGGLGIHLAGFGIEAMSYGENLLVGTGARRDDRKYLGRYVLSF